jgi:Type II secretion system (T2SS), protein G
MPNESGNVQRPPYLLGLLCLIPLVGALVGLGLLLYGIFKYKDKWLIMIGAFGIGFTIFIYSMLFYSFEHSSVVKNGFQTISQMQLNSLVRYVEFYKLQNGEYPDDLDQISKDDKLAPVNDALQTSSFKQQSYYNYKREGDKYRLFSSGIDGIPGTRDDLYPEIIIKDSSKIGLIR